MADSDQMSAVSEASPTARRFLVVGVGASAGGLDALRRLLEAVPENPPFALVIVHHLARDTPSLASELLADCTRVPVRQAEHEQLVNPGCVYIVSPGQFLGIADGKLILIPIEGPPSAPNAIDNFFRALARDQQECAVGIVLSGTGSDGTLGIKAIKEAGGFVLAQDPSTADHSGMPASAIATGIVDQVMRPEAMPEALTRISEHDYIRKVAVAGDLAMEDDVQETSDEDSQQQAGDGKGSGGSSTGDDDEVGLDKIIDMLNRQARQNFRNYKPATLARRTRRRMCLQHIDQYANYVKFLDEHPDEIHALGKDLLISVTDFFRDHEVWRRLATNVIPQMVGSKSSDDVVRVWSAGCATGEEAYTIAILILEELSKQGKSCKVQIFASDVDEDAIAYARAGDYPISIEADVSPERLTRFFTRREDGPHYQVSESLREVVLFAGQNLMADPPFSRLDLVCCRNLLIYLKPEMQRKIISLFHFALLPSGVLLLGTAETVGRQDAQFQAIDREKRIFRSIGRSGNRNHTLRSTQFGQNRRMEIRSRSSRVKNPAQLAEQALLAIISPSAIMIDRQWQILYISGNVNAYLTHQEGVPNNDLLRKLHPSVRSQVRSAVLRTYAEMRPITVDARIESGSDVREIQIHVQLIPTTQKDKDFVLIRFEEVKNANSVRTDQISTNVSNDIVTSEVSQVAFDEDSRIMQLERELCATREDLQSTVEQFEIASEESMASNEEVMSVNEELQSANEELETSKEELQSLNEELSTVNLRLASKVDELEVKHADLENLVAATHVATICLGTDFTIRWFTTATRELIRIKATDIGRPLRDLQNDFLNDDLFEECERVLSKLIATDAEVDCTGERAFFRRIVPYRSDGHRIGGIVITLLDITPLRKREAELLESQRQLRELNTTLEQKVVQRTQLLGILQHATKVANEAKSVKEAMRGAMANLAEHNGWRVGHVWRPKSDAVHQDIVRRDTVQRENYLHDTLHVDDSREPKFSSLTSLDASLASAKWTSTRIWHVDEQYRYKLAGLEEFQRVTEQMTVRADEGIVGLVLRSGRPQQVRNISDLQDTARSKIAGLSIRGAIAFPITIDDEIVAVMEFFSEYPTDPEPAFLALMADVGIQLGHVIQRKRLEQVVANIANEQEKRIGRELHDGIAQQLTGGALIAESLRKSMPEHMTNQRDNAEHLVQILRETHDDVSLLSRGLMPDAIAAADLLPALRSLVDETQRRFGVNVSLKIEAFDQLYVRSDSPAATIYQIAREAIHNALKHSGSNVINVELSTVKNFRMVVRDYGDGFDTSKFKPKSNGMRIMRYRAETIGGELTLQSTAGEGTRVTLTIPKTRCQS